MVSHQMAYTKNQSMNAVFSAAGRTPGDIQQLCHALWETSEEGDVIDIRSVARAL